MRNLILFLLLMVLLSGCGLETKTLAEFYDGELENVNQILIVDGETGYRKTVINCDDIHSFLENIKSITFIPEENQEKRVGFRYSLTFFEGEQETFSFAINEIDDHYYYSEPDIFPVVDKFYQSLQVEEEGYWRDPS